MVLPLSHRQSLRKASGLAAATHPDGYPVLNQASGDGCPWDASYTGRKGYVSRAEARGRGGRERPDAVFTDARASLGGRFPTAAGPRTTTRASRSLMPPFCDSTLVPAARGGRVREAPKAENRGFCGLTAVGAGAILARFICPSIAGIETQRDVRRILGCELNRTGGDSSFRGTVPGRGRLGHRVTTKRRWQEWLRKWCTSSEAARVRATRR